MNKELFYKRLDKLLYTRFDTLSDLECELTKRFSDSHKRVALDFSYQNYEIDHTPDWNLCGSVEYDELIANLDIYFLYDREQRLVITEIAVDFEYYDLP